MTMKIVSLFFLCTAGVLFPFAVAASNAALGILLALGIFSGMWWQGAKQCWHQYRFLSIALVAYFALMLAGLLWTPDLAWAAHVLGRQWFWLLIPVVVALLSNASWRRYFLMALSTGLTLHLFYCVLQVFGYVTVDTGGSNASDATGLIGHIGFGFVYGVWAAWLLHLGLMWRGRQRILVWFLACWAYVMIFAAQGRSGYLIAVVLVMVVLAKWLYDSKSWQMVMPGVVVMLLILLVVALGPGKERVEGTWLAFTQSESEQAPGLNPLDSSDNAILATEERFSMWKTSLEIWRSHPLLGVGTGGLPYEAARLKAEGLSHTSFVFVHPHNQYLLNLIRWGPTGLLVLLLLFYACIRQGLMVDWQSARVMPLITLSAMGLAMHALSSSSMEEHFSGVLAAILIATALSEGCREHAV